MESVSPFPLSGFSGSEAERAAYRLLEGEKSPLSRLIDELYQLAKQAYKSQAVLNWMRTAGQIQVADYSNGQTKGGLIDFPKMAEGAADWLDKFHAFLSEFGDRSGHGYGSSALISTPTWHDQPILAIQLAAHYLDDAMEDPRQQREHSRQAIDVKVEALCSKCPDLAIIEGFFAAVKHCPTVYPRRGDPQPPY